MPSAYDNGSFRSVILPDPNQPFRSGVPGDPRRVGRFCFGWCGQRCLGVPRSPTSCKTSDSLCADICDVDHANRVEQERGAADACRNRFRRKVRARSNAAKPQSASYVLFCLITTYSIRKSRVPVRKCRLRKSRIPVRLKSQPVDEVLGSATCGPVRCRQRRQGRGLPLRS